MEANRVLNRLGFHCCRVGSRSHDPATSGPGNGEQQDVSSIARRLSGAEAALAVAQEAIAGLSKRVSELEATK
jgi:hypothetical protein